MNHLIVIGGGAAGFFCAVNAARLSPGLKVTILEKTGKVLSKVRVSGGGRCNVTHALFTIPELSRRYPRGQNFVKKTFFQFSAESTVAWFRERGVALKTESDGRMFPVTDSSETIIRCLQGEAEAYGVQVRTGTEVKEVQPAAGGFDLRLADGSGLRADFLCIATGGYPKSAQFDWLRALGHTVVEPLPSLFTLNLPGHPIRELMGVSVPQARIKIGGTKWVEEGPVLITHWGLSGPAVIRLSAWAARDLAEREYRFPVHLNWVPSLGEEGVRAFFRRQRAEAPVRKLAAEPVGGLPQRLWNYLIEGAGATLETRFSELPSKTENALVRGLTDAVFAVDGKTTFKEEFVTSGGIHLSEVHPQTMESRKCSGLYLAGEVLDVDGITGGFNFQHAWTSGYLAAAAIASRQSASGSPQ